MASENTLARKYNHRIVGGNTFCG